MEDPVGAAQDWVGASQSWGVFAPIPALCRCGSLPCCVNAGKCNSPGGWAHGTAPELTLKASNPLRTCSLMNKNQRQWLSGCWESPAQLEFSHQLTKNAQFTAGWVINQASVKLPCMFPKPRRDTRLSGPTRTCSGDSLGNLGCVVFIRCEPGVVAFTVAFKFPAGAGCPRGWDPWSDTFVTVRRRWRAQPSSGPPARAQSGTPRGVQRGSLRAQGQGEEGVPPEAQAPSDRAKGGLLPSQGVWLARDSWEEPRRNQHRFQVGAVPRPHAASSLTFKTSPGVGVEAAAATLSLASRGALASPGQPCPGPGTPAPAFPPRGISNWELTHWAGHGPGTVSMARNHPQHGRP